MAKTLNSRIPEGPVAEKWTNYKAHKRLVNPKNKLKLDVIVVGTGLAGTSAAASLVEMGFNILNSAVIRHIRSFEQLFMLFLILQVVIQITLHMFCADTALLIYPVQDSFDSVCI